MTGPSGALILSISARPLSLINIAGKPAMSPTIPSGPCHKFDPIRKSRRVKREIGREGGREGGSLI